MTKIAVLIPCYNEAKTIKKVVEDYKKALPEATIYVYDNNSTDKTDVIAKKAGATVCYEYRQGKGNVIRSMFLDIEADCYLMVDGDDTYPSENAREMCNLVLEGKADMVIGDRLSSTYFKENKRAFHNSGNRIVRWLINHLFDNKIKDIMTGYRAFSYDFVKGFPVLSKGFEIETEMTIFAVDKNYKIKEIPVNYRDRPFGSVSKLNTYKDGMKVLKTIVSLFKDYNLEQVNRMQVSKQADIMILFLLMEDLFSLDVKKANWNYYEPKTLHDSSLSLSTHVILASDMKDKELAYNLFERAIRIDMGENMKSSDHGIHAASIAGMFLTTECVIVEKKEEKTEMPMAAPGMGGMGGMM